MARPAFVKFVEMINSDVESATERFAKVDVQNAVIREGQESVKEEILGAIENQHGIEEMERGIRSVGGGSLLPSRNLGRTRV